MLRVTIKIEKKEEKRAKKEQKQIEKFEKSGKYAVIPINKKEEETPKPRLEEPQKDNRVEEIARENEELEKLLEALKVNKKLKEGIKELEKEGANHKKKR